MATMYARKATVMMKLTEQEHKELSSAGWFNLEKFKQGKGVYTNWFNIAFRLRFGLDVAKEYYEDLTVLELKLCYDKVIAIISRPDQAPDAPLYMTKEEIESVALGLEAVDTMQRQVLRKDMAPLMRGAVMYMRNKYAADKRLQPLPPKRLR